MFWSELISANVVTSDELVNLDQINIACDNLAGKRMPNSKK